MLLGYARVSSTDQNTDLQIDALRRAGVSFYWEEQRSGISERPELASLLRTIGPGETLVVYKIDRLARSLRDLLRISEQIERRGAQLRSLTEPIDTTSAIGRMFFQMICVLAEFERSMIKQRCAAGIAAAKARGAYWGRKRSIDYAEVMRLRTEGQTIDQIAASMDISRNSAWSIVRRVQLGLAPLLNPRGQPTEVQS